MTGKHRSIKMCFLPVGHTKFSPDWAFGMIKRKLRYTKVSSLSELKDCIHASSPVSGVNMACVAGSEDGKVLVPVRNWQSFLRDQLDFKKIDGIKNLHYFTFAEGHRGAVQVQEHSEASAHTITMTTASITSHSTPAEIDPAGLSYLYEKIRQFCTDKNKDILCPKPPPSLAETAAVAEAAPEPEPVPSTSTVVTESLPPLKRRKPTCSFCHKEGHRNAKKCDGTYWCPARN